MHYTDYRLLHVNKTLGTLVIIYVVVLKVFDEVITVPVTSLYQAQLVLEE